MNYISNMNEALAYINENIDKEIDLDKISKIACMSKSSFQKMFLFIADTSIGEYIRKLRLNLAAQDLINTDEKIIDISLKYGYESAAAFSRAFKNLYGKTPSLVREDKTIEFFPPIKIEIEISKGEMKMNNKAIIKVEEHRGEKAICFEVDCYDAEERAWGQMSKWCKENIPDRTARRYVGLAPKGHHPDGEPHKDASEHVKHPYQAMMLLIGEEGHAETFHGMPVVDAPEGIYLVNDVALNQFDNDGNLDMALSMMKASDAFMEFVQNTDGYEFDMKKGVFYEEHIFSEDWFQKGGLPTAFKMWVPVISHL